MSNHDVSLEDIRERDCDPETDQDEYNHRYDDEGNEPPFEADG